MKRRTLFLGAVFAAASSAAMALPPLPDWQQLESYFQQDKSTELARRSILTALPPGTSAAAAREALIADGATCKQRHNKPGVETCLIHQYSLLDGAADDVRWTLTLKEEQGRITAILVDRYVDRHGSA
jgi:hypothetical protein